MGMLNPMRDKDWRHVPGGERDDTCGHGLSRRSLRVKPLTSWAGKWKWFKGKKKSVHRRTSRSSYSYIPGTKYERVLLVVQKSENRLPCSPLRRQSKHAPQIRRFPSKCPHIHFAPVGLFLIAAATTTVVFLGRAAEEQRSTFYTGYRGTHVSYELVNPPETVRVRTTRAPAPSTLYIHTLSEIYSWWGPTFSLFLQVIRISAQNGYGKSSCWPWQHPGESPTYILHKDKHRTRANDILCKTEY